MAPNARLNNVTQYFASVNICNYTQARNLVIKLLQ